MANNIQTLTLGMGCFWSPDALFGSMPGVLRTRTGYAGGIAPNPTYREMGDHSETVELDFDSNILPLERILHAFWSHHRPSNINGYKGVQYRSLLQWRDEGQRDVMLKVREERAKPENGELDTDIEEWSGFRLAEDRHQKYYLKRYPDAIGKLRKLYSTEKELYHSTLAARLNGIAKGYANRSDLLEEIRNWPMSDEDRDEQARLIRSIKW